MGLVPCTTAMGLVAPFAELKNRKKLEPTSMARPAASAASMAATDVIPLLASGAGQSLRCMISTGLTSHQIAPVVTKLSSTTWLWFGVGTNKGAFGGFGMPGIPASRTDRSTEEACMVQVPGTGLFGSGHCVWTLGLVFQASGM